MREIDSDGDTLMPDFEQPPAPEGMDPGTAARLHHDFSLASLEHEMECYREWTFALNYAVKAAEWRLERCGRNEERERIVRKMQADAFLRDRLMDRRAGLEAYWTWQRGELWAREGWEMLDGIE